MQPLVCVVSGQSSSDYFIHPTVQSQVAAACFIATVAKDPAKPQAYSTRAASARQSSVKHSGMGIFYSSRRAVTADHNFPVGWPTGTTIAISFPGM